MSTTNKINLSCKKGTELQMDGQIPFQLLFRILLEMEP